MIPERQEKGQCWPVRYPKEDIRTEGTTGRVSSGFLPVLGLFVSE